MHGDMGRREFIRLALLAAAGATLAGCGLVFDSEQAGKPKPDHKNGKGPTPRRQLGRTGMAVSIFALGGAFTVAQVHLRDEAESIINRALDLGVNLIDTAPTYGGSESNIGAVMRCRRDEAYLAGKTLDRTYDGTMRLFKQSLQRLQTDYLDLFQLHAVHSAEDLRRALEPDGACRALQELISAGAVKAAGITGHKNYDVLLRAVEEYDFDCVALALNPGEAAVEPLLFDLLRAAVRRDLGIIAMKVPAYGRIFRQGGIETMDQALGYALSHPVSTAVVGISTLAELEQNVSLARGFKPLTPGEMSSLEALAHPYRDEITFYKHW